MDYGDHAPFIFAAYAASFVAIGALIFWRLSNYRRASKSEERRKRNQN